MIPLGNELLKSYEANKGAGAGAGGFISSKPVHQSVQANFDFINKLPKNSATNSFSTSTKSTVTTQLSSSIIPSTHLFNRSVSPKAKELIAMAAEFITDKVIYHIYIIYKLHV
jgi:phage-related tail protein